MTTEATSVTARQCKACGLRKPLVAEEFDPHPSGFRHVCRACMVIKRAKAYRERVETKPGFVEARNRYARERYAAGGEESRGRARRNAKAYRDRDRKRALEIKRRHYWRLRARVAEKLGGRCAVCGCTESRALQIDHPNGGGSEHRRRMNMTRYLGEVLRAPEGTYRLLCANCNWEHRLALLASQSSSPHPNRYTSLLREKVIRHYGGACVTCGCARISSLQLDHVHGGGNEERRSMTRTVYYRAALSAPPGKFQVLCANCNWIKRLDNPNESTEAGRRRRAAEASTSSTST